MVLANIAAEVDPVDGEFDVNEELGYSDLKEKREEDTSVSKNDKEVAMKI